MESGSCERQFGPGSVDNLPTVRLLKTDLFKSALEYPHICMLRQMLVTETLLVQQRNPDQGNTNRSFHTKKD